MTSSPDKHMLPVSHLTDNDFKKWDSKLMDDMETEQFLEHTASCSRCACRFMQWMENIPLNDSRLESPPAYLEDEILNRCHQPDMQLTRTLIDTTGKIHFWIYGLKITTAVVLSIMMLFRINIQSEITDKTVTMPQNPFSISKLQEIPDDYRLDSEYSNAAGSSIMEYLRNGSMSLNQNLQKFSDDIFPVFNRKR